LETPAPEEEEGEENFESHPWDLLLGEHELEKSSDSGFSAALIDFRWSGAMAKPFRRIWNVRVFLDISV
jgi:hypothetical protein